MGRREWAYARALENPIYLDETSKGHEIRRGVKKAAPCTAERVSARASSIEKKILGDGDSDGDDSEDDMDDVHPPLQATPGMSDHQFFFVL